MKKVLSLLLSFLLIVGLTGCSAKNVIFELHSSAKNRVRTIPRVLRV